MVLFVARCFLLAISLCAFSTAKEVDTCPADSCNQPGSHIPDDEVRQHSFNRSSSREQSGVFGKPHIVLMLSRGQKFFLHREASYESHIVSGVSAGVDFTRTHLPSSYFSLMFSFPDGITYGPLFHVSASWQKPLEGSMETRCRPASFFDHGATHPEAPVSCMHILIIPCLELERKLAPR